MKISEISKIFLERTLILKILKKFMVTYGEKIYYRKCNLRSYRLHSCIRNFLILCGCYLCSGPIGATLQMRPVSRVIAGRCRWRSQIRCSPTFRSKENERSQISLFKQFKYLKGHSRWNLQRNVLARMDSQFDVTVFLM